MKPRYIVARVFDREQAHRRGVIAATAFLFLFSISPIFGHHLAEPLTAMLSGRDHLLNICLVALHALLAPVHGGFHLLIGAGFAYATADRIRAARRMRATLEMLATDVPEPESVVGRAALSVGVDPRLVRVVRGPGLAAFTAGFWRPMIFVAADLATRVSTRELAAVIAHEDAHRRRRDPLRLSVWRFLACMLFFLPVVRRLAEDMSDEAEVAADDEAVQRVHIRPLTLASALLTIAKRFGGRPAAPTAATAFHREEMLGRRVRRLAGEDAAVGTHLTRRSALSATFALIVVWLSGLIVAHPLPLAAASPAGLASSAAHSHCSHDHRWAITHLFCRGFAQIPSTSETARGVPGKDCPHSK